MSIGLDIRYCSLISLRNLHSCSVRAASSSGQRLVIFFAGVGVTSIIGDWRPRAMAASCSSDIPSKLTVCSTFSYRTSFHSLGHAFFRAKMLVAASDPFLTARSLRSRKHVRALRACVTATENASCVAIHSLTVSELHPIEPANPVRDSPSPIRSLTSSQYSGRYREGLPVRYPGRRSCAMGRTLLNGAIWLFTTL